MKSSDSTVAKAHHPDMEQPQTGQVTLLVWQVSYERENRIRKPTPKTDVLGPWRLTAVQRITRHEKTNEEEEEEDISL